MERYSERQTSTIFAEEPAPTHGTSTSAKNATGNATPTSVASLPPLLPDESEGSMCPGAVGVTDGCRTCIHDASKEQQRERFLRQKCPLSMAWVRICGDAPAATATFEENAAQSLRSSHSVSNLQSTGGAHADPSATNSSSRRRRMWSDDAGRPLGEAGRTAAVAAAAASEVGKADDAGVLPPARFGHTAVLYRETQMIVFGGKANDEHHYNDVYSYDVERRAWTQLTEDDTATRSPSSPASAPAAAVPTASPRPNFSNSGAATPHAAFTRANTEESAFSGRDAELLTPTTATTPSVTPAAAAAATLVRARSPSGRVGHAAALHQDTMYVLSGEQQGRYLDDMWAFDLPTRTWAREGAGLPFAPRKGHTMHLLPAENTANRAQQDMLVIFGGLVRVSRQHPRPADPELPPRAAGEPEMICAPTSETLLYYPAQRRWCHLKTCGDVPKPRFYHVSQLVTGTTLLLVFGGRTVAPAPLGSTAASDGAFMNDLHILDVATGMWRQIRDATGDVPSPRMCAASIFVNGAFAVFAGGGNGYCRHAYEFQLCDNRWRRLMPDYQPACSRPTVVYAKDRLVFFGGYAPRRGVLNCTMELCLSPLSLTNRSLLWWNRCAFEKHVRQCSKQRILEQQERAAALLAMTQSCRADGNCGRQVTLRHNPANVATSSSSSALPTPRQSATYRKALRPAPVYGAAHERTAVYNTPATSSVGHNEVSPRSPASSYAPSSPAVGSPVSTASQSLYSWHDPVAVAIATAATFTTSAPPAGLYTPSLTAASPSFRVSPASTAGAVAGAASPRLISAFPSRPDVVSPIYVGAALAGTANNASSTATKAVTSMQHAGQPVRAVHQAQYWQDPHSSHSGCPNSGATNSLQQSAVAVQRWTDDVQYNVQHSVTSRSTDATPSQHSKHAMVGPASPREPSLHQCPVSRCVRNIAGFVATSMPRFHVAGPPPAAAAAAAVTPPSPQPPQPLLSSSPSSLPRRTPLQTKTAYGPLHIDVTARSPQSPQPIAGESRWVSPQSPVAFGSLGSSAQPSAFSSHRTSQQWPVQRQQSVRCTESDSSRASSMHSVRSLSCEAVALSQVKQLIERLEGPSGPFLFRALANRIQKGTAAQRSSAGNS